jgi:hypothetical protein
LLCGLCWKPIPKLCCGVHKIKKERQIRSLSLQCNILSFLSLSNLAWSR